MGQSLAATNPDLCRVGNVISDLTITQVNLRDLDPGETRDELVRKVGQGILKRKWHSFSAVVQAAGRYD